MHSPEETHSKTRVALAVTALAGAALAVTALAVGTLEDGYVRRVPIPRVIPRRQSAPTSDL